MLFFILKPDEIGMDLSNKNLIQVTFVQPYFDENSSSTDQENKLNVKKFYYDMPFYGGSGQKVSTAELGTSCKVKVILQSKQDFFFILF
jgi:hypothetical protein